jgi:replication factor C subunit 3/5
LVQRSLKILLIKSLCHKKKEVFCKKQERNEFFEKEALRNAPLLVVSPNKHYVVFYRMENKSKSILPWVEKYRPTNFDDVVLDPQNKILFNNIIKFNNFPNLLFYGPPGSGKTSTIINLIEEYQKRYNVKNRAINRGNIIHLNASDERGIDIIRNQIYQFIISKNLFDNGLKFVVLDEVDYMTKNAQQALKYLLQMSNKNVRYCLICNYISKIDESLQSEFICIRFNQLPKPEIFKFIRNITKNENIELSDDMIEKIQSLYGSDIRSMINFIQSNKETTQCQQDVSSSLQKDTLLYEPSCINGELWKNMYNLIQNKHASHNDSDNLRNYIHNVSISHNIDKRDIILNYSNYVIRNYKIDCDFLDKLEVILHNSEHIPIDEIIDFL